MAGYNNRQSQNAFKNDGSFLEVFKRFQQQQQTPQPSKSEVQTRLSADASNAGPTLATSSNKPLEVPRMIPMVGKRKNKALKTGIVKKVKPDEDKKQTKPTDAWSLYLDEVKRYQETVGEQDNKTRPLVK